MFSTYRSKKSFICLAILSAVLVLFSSCGSNKAPENFHYVEGIGWKVDGDQTLSEKEFKEYSIPEPTGMDFFNSLVDHSGETPPFIGELVQVEGTLLTVVTGDTIELKLLSTQGNYWVCTMSKVDSHNQLFKDAKSILDTYNNNSNHVVVYGYITSFDGGKTNFSSNTSYCELAMEFRYLSLVQV